MDSNQSYLINDRDKNGQTPLNIADKNCAILLRSAEFRDVCIVNSAMLPPTSPNYLPKIETFRNSIRLPTSNLEGHRDKFEEKAASIK
mmetsp:Transcript_32008/g.36540  ORF Transcript_32008/g.36540 Transcript_32008/m.36540 type:complete len:88 (+) Transcript_32008:312-575(+)